MAPPQNSQQEWDTATPVTPPPAYKSDWDSATPIPTKTQIDPKQGQDAADSLIYSHLLNIPASQAYENHDSIADTLEERLGAYAKAGWSGLTKDSIIGEYLRGRVPDAFESHDEVQKWIEEFGQMAGDLPFYLAGALGGGVAGTFVEPGGGTAIGAGAGGFGLTAAMRQLLVDKYAAKKVSSFKEITDALLAGGKGALTGGAMTAAGMLVPEAAPVAGWLEKGGLTALRGASEIATMTTVGSLLEGKVPSAKDFVDNSALYAAMQFGTLGYRAAGDYLKNTYVEQGAHPADVVANPDAVKPPVEETEQPVGMLRPAIKVGDQVMTGEPGETHAEVLDKMVEPPESTEPGGADQQDRGFVTPKGQFLSRQEAATWVEENEPEVFKAMGDEGEFTSEGYNAANQEVPRGGAPRVVQTPEVSAMQRLLTKVRDSVQSSKFGGALRTLFVGRRNAWIAETNQLVGDLRELVPDYQDQEALSLMRDFKGNNDDLAARRAAYEAGDNPKLKKLIPIIDKALNPTPEMLEADQRMTSYFESHLALGKKLGFLDSRITNEQYITHLLRPEETEEEQQAARRQSGGLPSAGIGRYFPFAKERTYPTILDALETGKVKALSLNAFDAMQIYGSKWARAAATKQFINDLKQTEMGKWGFKNSDHVPDGWVELAPNSGLFRNTVPYIDKETGEPRNALQMLMVPPEVEKAMRPIIEGDTVRGLPGFVTFRATQAYIKAAELGLSVFHMKAMNITALNNMGPGRYVQSMRADMDSTEFRDQEIDGIKNGLETPILGQTLEAYRAVEPKTFPSRMDVIRELPGIKQADATAAWLTHETFDVIQRKFKVMDYSMKTAAWMADHPEAEGDELGAAKRSIAKEINAAYGGLNWEVLGASKNFRAVAQAILLAPDWTFSNILNLKYAFEGGPGGQAARAFWMRSAITGMAMTQAMSILVSHQPSSHPSEVYLGKDKYGKEVYSNTFFAGAPKDFITWMNNVSDMGAVVGTAVTIGTKLSPVLRTAEELQENRDWMGRQIVKRGSGALKGTAQGLEHIAWETAPLPFSVTDTIRMLTDTEHDYGIADYISLIGGTPPRHVLPAGAKPQRKKRFSIRGDYK